MMSLKEQVLSSIRRKLADTSSSTKNIEAQYAQLQSHIVPIVQYDLVDEFELQLKALSGLVTRIKTNHEIVSVVLNHIQNEKIASDLLISSVKEFKQLSWPESINLKYGKASKKDKIALSLAYAGVAETGSIVMLSSPQTPTSHNFMVEDHLLVLQASKIVTNLEDVWTSLECKNMPRTVNVLTGPSRTGDVEQTIQIGAHGPLRFHVIILEDS